MKTTLQYQSTYKDGAKAMRIALNLHSAGRVPPMVLEAFWAYAEPVIPAEEAVRQMLPSQVIQLLADQIRMVWWYPEKEETERTIKYFTLMSPKMDAWVKREKTQTETI